jgi:transglutaminase-like putative cysteine protease
MRLSVCVVCLLPALAAADEPKEKAKSRSFLFTYAGAITGVEPGQSVSIWLPVPPSNEEQQVEIVSKKLPAGAKLNKEGQYDNRMFFFEAKPGADGKIPFEIVYRVTRHEIRGLTETMASDMNRLTRFLQPDELVPITGKPLDLLKGKTLPDDPMGRAKEFYEIVNNHMKYAKPAGKPWGRGDVLWVCDSKYGNCTDFHSLFISLARAHKIPAKFEIGFGIPEKRGKGIVGGYHCWAKFRPNDKGWVGVDISEANKDPKMKDYYFGNLTEDRVTFTTGRDIDLAPKQKGKALNFFVYPYAEIDGKPVANDKIERSFAYEEVK